MFSLTRGFLSCVNSREFQYSRCCVLHFRPRCKSTFFGLGLGHLGRASGALMVMVDAFGNGSFSSSVVFECVSLQ